MNELENFKKSAFKIGLCDEYKSIWSNVKSKSQCIDMISSCQGAQYFISAKNSGIAPTNEYILNEFGSYINGGYIAKVSDYDTQWYIENKEDVNVNTLFTYVLDSKCVFNLCGGKVFHITFAGKSDVTLNIDKDTIVYVDIFGESVTLNGDVSKIKRIRNKEYSLK